MDEYQPYGIINHGGKGYKTVRGNFKWIFRQNKGKRIKPTSIEANKVAKAIRRTFAVKGDMFEREGIFIINQGYPDPTSLLSTLGIQKRHKDDWSLSVRSPSHEYIQYANARVYDTKEYEKYRGKMAEVHSALSPGKGKRKNYDGAIDALIEAERHLRKSVKPCDVCRDFDGSQKGQKQGNKNDCENCAGFGRYQSMRGAKFGSMWGKAKHLDPYYIYPHTRIFVKGKRKGHTHNCFNNAGDTPNCAKCGIEGFLIDPSKYHRSDVNYSAVICSVCEGSGGEKCSKCDGSGWLS